MFVELVIRFIVGGVFVTLFALSGDVLRPKSFAGIFGAAPSVALATLVLTINANGREFAATEARAMIGGAIAFFIYACCASRAMMRWGCSAGAAAGSLTVVWLLSAAAAWVVWLR